MSNYEEIIIDILLGIVAIVGIMITIFLGFLIYKYIKEEIND